MAWTDLTYPYGSQLTSTQMTQNQDNFTALATGLTGSPKITPAAIKAATNSSPATTVWKFCSNAATVFSSTAATNSTYQWLSVDPNNISLTAMVAGSFTVSVELMGTSGGDANLRVYVNGVQALLLQDGTAAGVWSTAKTGTLTVAAGDFIVMSLHVSGGETQANMRDLKILADAVTILSFV